MKRSHAPSALAAKKKVREKQLGIDSDSESDGMVSEGLEKRTHNESAFDRFVSVLKKIAKKSSTEADFEEDDDLASVAPPPSDDKENDGMIAYFGVYYSQRQSSRHFDAALAAEGSGEGMFAFCDQFACLRWRRACDTEKFLLPSPEFGSQGNRARALQEPAKVRGPQPTNDHW